MSNREGRKVVKYHKRFVIEVKGQTDTVLPDEVPFALRSVEDLMQIMVNSLDVQYKHRSVTIKELKGGDKK